MAFLSLLCTLTLFVSPLIALDAKEFKQFLESACFKDDEAGNLMINGQENPLSSTIENFIALAEKLEVANPNMDLKDELFYFIRNYTFDNIEFGGLGQVVKWKMTNLKEEYVTTLWEPDENQRKRQPNIYNDPFSEAEKCSLFFMISHSIIRDKREVSEERAMALNNSRSPSRSFSSEDLYPQEKGVVAIKGTDFAVALGPILTGMYVGLNKNRKQGLENFPKVEIDANDRPEQTTVDPLYLLTLSEVLALATWRDEAKKREKLANNGRWMSIVTGNDNDMLYDSNVAKVCPMIYRLRDGEIAALSHSSVRGAADGLILGKLMENIYDRKRDAKLSQLLRMYYSRDGIQGQAPDLGEFKASFCDRNSVLDRLDQPVKEQIYLYLLLASDYNDKKTLDSSVLFSWNYYTSQKSEIFNYNQVLRDYCTSQVSKDQPEKYPLESSLDVIAIMDMDGGQDNFKRQQLILANIATKMDLRQYGSRMTILLDKKIVPTSSTSADVTLKPVVELDASSACAACSVAQISYADGSSTSKVPEDEVVFALDQLLTQRKENETKYNGANGKVVIYFNFDDEQRSARPSAEEGRVNRQLQELTHNHPDIMMYALGKKQEVLLKFVRKDAKFVLLAIDGSEEEIANKLWDMISRAPGQLQYPDCQEAKSENSAIYENFVSPNTTQHWKMPAEYFYKSGSLKVMFESKYGNIRVCHSQATLSPELESNSCQETGNGNNKLEFKHSNPCKNFNQYTCSPFYFSIIGLGNSEKNGNEFCSDSNMDLKCRSLNQIKFAVSHEGIRCSGSVMIFASTALLFFAIIMQHIFSKM